jgi:hypothetical protein
MRIPPASVLLLAAVICGAGIGWRVYKGKAHAEAASLVRARAEQGDAKAQHDLAGMYYYGKGVPQNYAEAVTWYRKAAEQGNREAEYGLGLMYREGKGVPQDPAEAINWCRRAAEQGYARAQYALGNVYRDGWQVPQDYDAAASWYRKAAEQGYADAQYDLGYMYYYGYGVPLDRVEASRLFHQAAAQGNENARRAIGWNRVHAPVISNVLLPSKLLASFFFGFVFLKSGQSHRNRAKVATGVVALLFILSFVLDLFWYSYVGHLESSTTITALYFVRHLVGGVIIAMVGPIVHVKSAKVVLMASVVLFIGFVVYGVVLSELRHIPVTIRFFCFSGLFIGMFTPSAIFVWLDTKRTGPELNGKGEAAAPVAAK